MERWCGKVAVVTGASAGIGAAVCEKLVKHGLQVVGLARRVNRITELSKKLGKQSGKLHGIQCDISKKENIIKSFDWIKNNLGSVHILINNAGIVRNGTICESNPEEWEAVLKTNILGLAICSQEAIKQMREQKIAGHIINVNSVAGHSVIGGKAPFFLNVYSPSKYAVTALTKILRDELKHFKTDIKVTSFSPGAVDTEITKVGDLNFDYSVMPHLKSNEIADSIIYILGTPPNVLIREFVITALQDMH